MRMVGSPDRPGGGTAGDPHTRSLRRPKPVYSGQSCVLLGQNRWIAVPGLARPRLPTTANRPVREAGFSRGCSGPAGAALAATTMTGAACAQKLGGILRVHAQTRLHCHRPPVHPTDPEKRAASPRPLCACVPASILGGYHTAGDRYI